MNYAIVDANNLVTNVILWDGEPSWKPPADCITAQIPADSVAGVGWSYVDGEFVAPPQEVLPAIEADPIPELTPAEKLAASGLTVEELKQLLGLES
jgi:hypothetical protein